MTFIIEGDIEILKKNSTLQFELYNDYGWSCGYRVQDDRYYVAYKPITLLCLSFMYIEMKFIHYQSYVMFKMKYVSICND